MNLIITGRADRDVAGLDPEIRQRIGDAVRRFAESPSSGSQRDLEVQRTAGGCALVTIGS